MDKNIYLYMLQMARNQSQKNKEITVSIVYIAKILSPWTTHEVQGFKCIECEYVITMNKTRRSQFQLYKLRIWHCQVQNMATIVPIA